QGELEKVSSLILNLPPRDALKGQMFHIALIFFKGRYDEVIDRTTEIIQEGREMNDWFSASWALIFKLWSLNLRNKFNEFDEIIEETWNSWELVHESGINKTLIQEISAFIYGQRAAKETFNGNWDNALMLARKGSGVVDIFVDKNGQPWSSVTLNHVRILPSVKWEITFHSYPLTP
ncbi:MAG: hypothetical protein ACXAEU_09610, partial [Candidatus Hodarchaeales archaeon]